MKKINILSVGNSFSQDAHRYLHDLAKGEKVCLETVNLYIGGCSLETHAGNMRDDRRAYELEVNGHSGSGFFVTIREALAARAWDYITLQQASHFSYREETYMPYVKELADYIRACCPTAKLLLHQTWGYESGSDRIREHGFETYDEMFAEVKRCYDEAAASIGADGMIPAGAVLGAALKSGITSVHRDAFHASYGVGRILLALTWYKYLTGNSIDEMMFRAFDEKIDEHELRKVVTIVNRSVCGQS